MLKSFLALLLATQLGTVSFPTSTQNTQAQAEFDRGVAALHSFWYEEAADAFRAAQKLDPSFAMAYWGEAMTFNHPIWQEQDRDGARAVLAKAPKAANEREAAWLKTLDVLYGDGDKPTRDEAYERAMDALSNRDPDDLEMQAFHALAILGTMDRGAGDARKQMRAATILEPLMPTHPDHPGVLHYSIHAYDDPLHAPLGLRAAQRYAKVAPAAHHALHMPSHIFLQLGMWDEAASSNEHSWAASVAWVERAKLAGSKRDLHSLQWLHYIYLQQGRREDARKLWEQVATPMSDRERGARTRMLAQYAVETGEIVPLGESGGDDVFHCAAPAYGASEALSFTKAINAIHRKDADGAKSAIAALVVAKEAEKRPVEKRTIETMELVARALDFQRAGDLPHALETAKRATEIEETLGAPSGPPDVLKPAHELYGELLLAAGRREEAVKEFEASLLRTPNRRLSLEGLTRAKSR